MKKPKKRDRAYWLKRLRHDHPDFADRFDKGEFPSVRAACIEAGLLRKRSPLMVLKNEWKKASPRERDEFLAWAGRGTKAAPVAAVAPAVLIGSDGLLTEAAIAWIDSRMSAMRLASGDLMRRIGRSHLDGSLGNALQLRSRPDPEMIENVKRILSL